MNDIGVIVLGTVVLGLLGFGCRGFFINSDIHLALRMVVAAIGVGILVLVIRTVRARLSRNQKKERREVEK
ncbi:MAG: hypothetical protein PHY18_00895 [Dehalococcoidales bacterium]|nr:hypothetical protein [Dehalococcoidales bacterium]